MPESVTRQVALQINADPGVAQRAWSAMGATISGVGGTVTGLVGSVFNLRNLLVGAAGALGVFKLVGFLRESYAAAIEVEAIHRRFISTFKESESAMTAWAISLGKATKQDDDLVKQLSSSLGMLFTNLGFTGNETSKLSQQMTALALDMSEFYRADPSQMAHALQSALMGNTRALRQFGISIRDDAIEAKALEMGFDNLRRKGEGLNRDLTQQEKALTAIEIITKATANAQGMAEKSSGTLRSELRGAGVAWGDLKETIGLFVKDQPILVDSVKWIGEAFRGAGVFIDQHKTGLKTLTDEGLKPVSAAFKEWSSDVDRFVARGGLLEWLEYARAKAHDLQATLQGVIGVYHFLMRGVEGIKGYAKTWSSFMTEIGHGIGVPTVGGWLGQGGSAKERGRYVAEAEVGMKESTKAMEDAFGRMRDELVKAELHFGAAAPGAQYQNWQNLQGGGKVEVKIDLVGPLFEKDYGPRIKEALDKSNDGIRELIRQQAGLRETYF